MDTISLNEWKELVKGACRVRICGEYFDRCLECAYQIDKFKEYAGKELAISFSELDRVFKEG